MPKTYNSLTVANAAAGSAILASDHAKAFENINNYRVPPMCRASVNANQTITNDAWRDVTWHVQDYDTDSDEMFTAGGTTITIKTAGVYLITAGLALTVNATGARAAKITKGAASNAESPYVASNLTTGTTAVANSIQVSAVVSCSASDAFKVAFYHNSGSGSFNVLNEAGTFFSATWLGQVS